jgi:hypothetical protein
VGRSGGVRLAALEALTGREGGDIAILADWGEMWLRDREKHHKVWPKSSENDRSRWENHLLPHSVSNMPLRAIRPADLDGLVLASVAAAALLLEHCGSPRRSHHLR